MEQLFELPNPVKKVKSKDRCRHCKHIYSHYYNSGMKYCRKQPGYRTSYGHRKIKANNNACLMFEKLIK